jgi:hypothetical protein
MSGRPVDDELIREMFERRARRASSDGLRASIGTATRRMRQRRHLVAIRGGRAPLRFLAVAALLTGLVGGGLLVAGRQQPRPVTMLSYTGFIRPFQYPDLPDAGLGTPIQNGNFLAFAAPGGPDPYPMTDGNTVRLDSFGITIATTQLGLTHPCPLVDGEPSRVPVREDPEGFLDDLRGIAGVATSKAEAITFDGRPATVVDVDPASGRCPYADFHVMAGGLASGFMRLNVPAQLIVTRVDGMTIVVQAWAGSPEALDAWLPTATEFLDHVHFADP